jgi:hypothetical protein
MTANELLDRLLSCDVVLTVDGDRLVVNAPRGVVDDGLLVTIRAHKADLIALVGAPSDDTVATVITPDLTLDQIANGEMEKYGFRIVGADLDLYGNPWRPKILVARIT